MTAESTPVVLTEAEKDALVRAASSPHISIASEVERILADRHAALLAEVAASRETLAQHREDWASYFESWESAVGATPLTVAQVIKALRFPVVPFGIARADATRSTS